MIQRLEALLNELGLALNPAKTSVMKMATFSEGLERRSVRSLKTEMVTSHLGPLEIVDNSTDASELLVEAGVPDETIWDLMYHHTLSIEDVIDQLVSEEGEDFAEAYRVFFSDAASMLRNDESTDQIAAIGSLAFECLALLSRLDVQLARSDLREVQRWFPGLTPGVVAYLTAGGHAEWSASAKYVRRSVCDPSGVDWVDAWMCYAASRLPANRLPVKSLRALISSKSTGPLTRIEAVRALALHGKLAEAGWKAAHDSAGPALAAEMLFAGIAMAAPPPWLAPYGRAARAPGVAGMIRVLSTPAR